MAVVPRSIGRLVKGDVLVSNFNDAGNLQGTGRTVVEISPSGHLTTFARIPDVPGGVGLTTALAVLPDGFVAVGNLPTSDGSSATARRGGLLVLNRNGALIDNITGADINGPWDLAATDFGDFAVLYITNVLNGTVAANGAVVHRATVIRLVIDVSQGFPEVISDTVIASGLAERTDPAALVVGPTGVALGRDGTLYVADTVNSAIRAIPNADFRTTSAGPGRLVSAGGALNAPLGLFLGQLYLPSANLWPFVGQLLLFPRPTFALSSANLWHFVGQLLFFPRPTFGLLLANLWPFVGQLMALCWPTFGPLLANLWPFVDQLMAFC